MEYKYVNVVLRRDFRMSEGWPDVEPMPVRWSYNGSIDILVK